MSQALPLPQTKNQLLAAVDKLSYTQRQNYAARLGRDHKSNPALRTLVNDLLKHPEPPVPEMDAEDGFTEILPPQHTSISKYYNEDQLALGIAVTAGMVDVIKAHLVSPSTFFDKFVVSNYVRMKIDAKKKGAYCASDADIVSAILSAVPARRRLLIQESIQAKRLGAISQVVPLLMNLPNYPSAQVAHIIHACAPETVKQFLSEHKFQKTSGLVWNKLTKLHMKTIIELMEKDLKETEMFERSNVWSNWTDWILDGTKTTKNVLKNRKAMESILDLAIQYPIVKFISKDYNEPPTDKVGHVIPSIPDIIYSNIVEYTQNFPEKITKLAMSTVVVKYDNTVNLSDYTNTLLTNTQISLDNKYKIQFFQHILDTTPKGQQNTYIMGGLKTFVLHFPSHWNGYLVVGLFRMFLNFMKAHKPTEKNIDIIDYNSSILYMTNALQKYFTEKIKFIMNAFSKDEPKEAIKLKKQLDKHRKLLKDTIEYNWETLIQILYFDIDRKEDVELQTITLTLEAYANGMSADLYLAAWGYDNAKELMTKYLNYPNKRQQDKEARVVFILSKICNTALDQFSSWVKCVAAPDCDKEFAQKKINEVFEYVNSSCLEYISPSNVSTFFHYDIDQTFKYFIPIWEKDPIANIDFVNGIFKNLSEEQKLHIYKWYTLENQTRLFKYKSESVVSLYKELPTSVVSEAVQHFLNNPNLIDENTRNILVGYQDISDPKIRTNLQKMANSSNLAERNGAIESVILATDRCPDDPLVHITRTLKFIREKIKNESQKNRSEVLAALFKSESAILPEGFGESQMAIWNDMLADALQSSDLDESVYDKKEFSDHPVLKFFEKIAICSVKYFLFKAAKEMDKPLFEFGVEMLWKLYVFRHGEKKAANEFVIPYDINNLEEKNTETKIMGAWETDWSPDWAIQEPDSFYPVSVAPVAPVLPLSSVFRSFSHAERVVVIRNVLLEYLPAYEKRIAEKNPEWKTQIKYINNFFEDCAWTEIPELCELVRFHTKRIKQEAAKDDEGLYLINQDDDFRKILTYVFYRDSTILNKSELQEPIHIAMHSRLASQYVTKWVQICQEGCKKAREFKTSMDKIVIELLNISASAIHLKFVWRHLVTYMQYKLDDYIGKRKSFRGVFYVPPDQRRFERSCLVTLETRRSGGRERQPVARRRATTAGVITNRASEDPQDVLQEERAKEKEIEDEMEGKSLEERDHEDFFTLEACWGLYRLLPRQVDTLSKDWQIQILNGDRAIPYRVKATARWTVMPTVTYNDIVKFLNEKENPSETCKGLSVNVVEALLRGVMRNDEPTAPLSFLLSPKFLGSERAKAAIYAISQSIRYLPPNGLTNLIKACLEGKRRHQLKVSSYKELIRLLASTPSDEHLSIIFKEWRRTDLHRDIRIAIILSALEFLQSKAENFNKIAWKILENAATLEDQHEILIALLGTSPKESDTDYYVPIKKSLYQNSRIADHAEDFENQKIDEKHAENFANKVVAVAARTAKNVDVKFVALASLYKWSVAADTAIELTVNYLKNTSVESLLYSTIESEKAVFTERWIYLLLRLVVLCCKKENPSFAPLIDIAETLCNRVVSMPNKERTQRNSIVDLLVALLVNTPAGVHNGIPEGEDDKLISVYQNILGDLVGKPVFDARLKRINALVDASQYKKQDGIDKQLSQRVYQFIHDLAVYASNYPTVGESFYIQAVQEILENKVLDTHSLIVKLLKLDVVGASNSSAEYLYMLRRAAVLALSIVPKFAQSYPTETLQFWQSLFDFSEARQVNVREISKSSQVFEFSALSDSITKVIAANREVKRHHLGGTIIYNKNVKTLITTIVDRYIAILEGKSTDAFAKRVGDFLLEDAKFIVEATSYPVLQKILHLYFLQDSEKGQKLAAKMYRSLNSSYQYEAANKLISTLIGANLDKSKPSWGEDYTKALKLSGMELLSSSMDYGAKNFTQVDEFLDSLISSLPLFTKEEQVKITSQISTTILTASNFEPPLGGLSSVGVKFLNKYLYKYIQQPTAGAYDFTLEHQAVKDTFSLFLIDEELCKMIVKYHPKAVPTLVHTLILEGTAKEVKTNIVAILDLSFHFKLLKEELFSVFIHDLIFLSLSAEKKSKKYTEISFDVTLSVLTKFPSLIIYNQTDVLYFVNWAISIFIQEPDMQHIYTSLKEIFATTKIFSSLFSEKEKEIPFVVQLISSLIDLKHKKNVLPHQTFLPQQAMNQYTHISYRLALDMLTVYGPYLKTIDKDQFHWREDFVALLDRLCNVKDRTIVGEAWKIEIVQNKNKPISNVAPVEQEFSRDGDRRDRGFGDRRDRGFGDRDDRRDRDRDTGYGNRDVVRRDGERGYGDRRDDRRDSERRYRDNNNYDRHESEGGWE